MKKQTLTESQIHGLKRYIHGKYHGMFPYYTIPIKQAKILSKKGFIHREILADVTLTELGLSTLKEHCDPEFNNILIDGVLKGLF